MQGGGSLDSTRCAEIIKDRLYWISDKQLPSDHADDFAFNIDKEFVYCPINKDFGPLDLGKTYLYVTEVQELLEDPLYSSRKLFHHTSRDAQVRTNTACLMGCFQVLVLGRTAEEAWEPFSKVFPPLKNYRDSSSSEESEELSILDVLRGLEYAVKLGWFRLETFSLADYEHYGRRENGDLHWIVPGRFIAFHGPVSKPKALGGNIKFTPEDYAEVFKKKKVSMIIRLSKKEYDIDRFTNHGFQFRDIEVLGGIPPKNPVIQRFTEACENEKGVIAVHCDAGRGRTSIMLACYIMKHYKFPAAPLIGWIRLARPGSVLGWHHKFLVNKENSKHQESDNSEIFQSIAPWVQDLWDKRDNLQKEFESMEISKTSSETSPERAKKVTFSDSTQIKEFAKDITRNRRA